MRASLRVFPIALDFGTLTADDLLGYETYVLQLFRVAYTNWVLLRHGFDISSVTRASGRQELSREAAKLRRHPGSQTQRAHDVGGSVYYAIPPIGSARGPLREDERFRSFEYAEAAASRLGGILDVQDALLSDIRVIEAGIPPSQLARLPLWLRTMVDGSHRSKDVPTWAAGTLNAFESRDGGSKSGWNLVWQWYRSLLPISRSATPGSKFGVNADRQIIELPNRFWRRKPEQVFSDIQKITDHQQLDLLDASADEVPDDSDRLIDELPEQAPGPSFSLSPRARLMLSQSGLLSGSDAQQIEGVREVLLEALATLEAECEGSNAFAFITSVILAYKRDVSAEVTQISIDRLYANGVRLENASTRIKREIARGDLPEQAIPVGEAMDSVISLHGTIVMGTERGRELVARSRDFHRTESQVAEYKAQAAKFSASIYSSKNIFEDEAKELVIAVNNDIGEGLHPDRSTTLAQTTNSNLLVAMGQAVLSQSVASAFLASGVGHVAVAEVAALIDAIASFLLANSAILHALVASTGSDLAWLNSFLAWLQRRGPRQ